MPGWAPTKSPEMVCQMTKTAFWKRPAAALLAELTTIDSGLTSQEAAVRLLRYGRNDATASQASTGLAAVRTAPCQPSRNYPAALCFCSPVVTGFLVMTEL